MFDCLCCKYDKKKLIKLQETGIKYWVLFCTGRWSIVPVQLCRLFDADECHMGVSVTPADVVCSRSRS